MFHTIDAMLMNGDWPGGKNLLFSFPWAWILSCLQVSTFPWVCFFWRILRNLQENMTSGFHNHCSWTNWICHQVVIKLSCIYFVLHNHFIIIIIISSSISIHFLVLLNCLYLNPQVCIFVHFFSHPAGGEGQGWVNSCQVLVAGCWVKPRHLSSPSKRKDIYPNQS